MTNRRFPVAGTELTVPWEVAMRAAARRLELLFLTPTPMKCQLLCFVRSEQFGGFTEAELDTWYGKHWREVAQ